MNLLNILLDKKNVNEEDITLGGVYGLWDIARNKILISPTYLVYYKQAKDKDVKKILHSRLYDKIPGQVKKIQKYFKDRGFDYPSEPYMAKKLDDDSPFFISPSILDDEEIVFAVREHMRTVISLETEALRNGVTPDARELLFDILMDDNDAYSSILKLQKEKKWIDYPPAIKPQ